MDRERGCFAQGTSLGVFSGPEAQLRQCQLKDCHGGIASSFDQEAQASKYCLGSDVDG